MEAPIKVALATGGYGNYTAFACDDPMSLSHESNKFEAIVNALVAAGKIEIIDIEERRRDKILARATAPIAVPSALSDVSPV